MDVIPKITDEIIEFAKQYGINDYKIEDEVIEKIST